MISNVQSGVAPSGGRMLVVINGIAMPFEDARALDLGAYDVLIAVKHDDVARRLSHLTGASSTGSPV